MPISADISRHVLLTGPHHRNHRGGIGGVLAVYARYLAHFRFIPSYRPFRWKGWYLPYFAWNYVRFVYTLWHNPELRIVHIHGSSEGSIYRKYILFWTAKYLFQRRVLFHLHSPSFLTYYERAPRFAQAWMRRMAEESDLFVCLSESWQRECARAFPKARFVVLPNVVEPPTNPVVRAAHEGPLRLLFLGLLGPRKGAFDLVRTLYHHQSAWAGRVELTIGGNGEVAELTELIEELNLGDQVRYAGWVTGEKKTALLRQADVFVLPSYAEGMPMSILEAMSYGLPILSTTVGGIPEVVADGDNGFLVEPGDEAALAARIDRWLADPTLIGQMSERSSATVRSYFPEAVFDQLSALYEALLTNEVVPLETLLTLL
jgi:glycosyltransferase involved in cell wall biosynthesis